MKKQLHLTVFMLVLCAIGYAQTGTITGTTVDVIGPLPGVSVYLKDSNTETVTDLNGKFRINLAPEGSQVIVFKYIGYKTLEKEINISPNENLKLGNISLSEDSEQLENVMLNTTIAQSQMKSLSIQKNAANIMNVLASNSIGKLPDHNAAEAVQRIGGVTIERDQGEGRYVIVRGTPAEWNSTLVNGDRMPSTSSSNRGVPLDIFPSELIQYVQLSKALTPDMEGDAIGGSVNFITRTSASKKTLRFAGAVGYHGQSESRIFNGSAVYGDRFLDNKLGFIVGGSTWNRDWGSDNYEIVYDIKNKYAIDQLQLRDYLGNRTTNGFNAGMDYVFDNNHSVYLKGIWTDFLDTEERRRTRFIFDKGRVEHALTHTEYHSRFKGFEVGGGHQLSDKLKVDWKGSSYNALFWYDSPNGNPGLFDSAGAKDSENRGYYYTTFRQSGVQFDGLSGDGFKYFAMDAPDGVGETDMENFQPRVSAATPVDASQAKFLSAVASGRYVDERDNNFRADLEYEFSNTLKVDFGAKYKDKDRTVNRSVTSWTSDGQDLYMTDFQTEEFPTKGGFLTEIGEPYNPYLVTYPTQNAADDIPNRSGFKRTYQSPTSPQRADNTYKASEDISAFYAMATTEIVEDFTVVFGARYEHTSIDYDGYEIAEDREVSPGVFEDVVSPLNAKSDYGNFLPMINAKYSPDRDTNIRFALTKSFARPNFIDLSPSQTVNDQDFVIERGNPYLEPTEAWNFDLLAEHYYQNIGVISGGIFYKDISNVIFDSNTQEDIGGEQYTITTPMNAETAWLAGIEIGIQRRLNFLPGFLSGFGVDGNYTFTESEVQVPGRDEAQPLFGQSKHIFNAAIYYEKYGISARLAANYKGSFLARLQGDQVGQDRFYDKNLNLDFSMSYAITKKLRFNLELNNLLNEPLRYYHGDENRPEQVEWYSIRGQAGLVYNVY